MKKIVFNDGELRDSGINFNVFCLMQLNMIKSLKYLRETLK